MLGVGKNTVYEKAKAVGGMTRRFTTVCMSILGAIAGMSAAVSVSPSLLVNQEKGGDLIIKAATPAIHGSFTRAEIKAQNNSTKRFTKEFGQLGGRGGREIVKLYHKKYFRESLFFCKFKYIKSLLRKCFYSYC
jgi:hypothetical protein